MHLILLVPAAFIFMGCTGSWQQRVDNSTILGERSSCYGVFKDNRDLATVTQSKEIAIYSIGRTASPYADSAQGHYLGRSIISGPSYLSASQVIQLKDILLDPTSFTSRGGMTTYGYGVRIIGRNSRVDILVPSIVNRSHNCIQIRSNPDQVDALIESLALDGIHVGITASAMTRLLAILKRSNGTNK